MAEILGFIIALVAAVSFGTLLVPLKLLKKPEPIAFQAVMCTGIFSAGIAAILLFGFPISFENFAFASGIVWVLGNLFQIKAVKSIGLARGASIYMSTIILLSFVIGITLFQEVINILYLAAAGIASIIVGIVAVSMSKSQEKVTDSKKGIIFSLIAGLFFTLFGVLLNIGNSNPTASVFPMILGILLGGWILFLGFKRWFIGKIWPHGLAAGVLWAVGGIATIFSLSLIGVALTGPLTQLGLLFSVAWGVFLFREIKEKRSMIRIAAGSSAMVAGMLLLMFATI